jgi:3-deoxy-D-manno-octulosonic-acid transferase
VLTFLYRLGWLAARPLAAPLSLAGGKLGRAVHGRRAAPAVLAGWAARARDASRPLVWFHAASVGEGRQAEAVLRSLRRARPRWQIAYTFSSPSAERFAASLPADVTAYVPLDAAADVRAAVASLGPTALVFSATDVWPELARQAAARGVALAMVSATLAPTSSRRGALARRLLRPAYALLDRVGAVDPDDARALERLGARHDRITVTGDTRHDAALARLAAASPEAPHRRALDAAREGDAPRFRPRPLVLAGSTWPSDERVLLPAVADVLARGTRLRLVVAPHEPKPRHLAALERRLRQHLGAAATVVRLSSLLASAGSERLPTGAPPPRPPPSPPAWDAVVVDQVGVLAELYTAASVAYVGGGFHRAGLHSVIEPAAAAVPVLFGPLWRGSRDARLLLDARGARAARDRRELAAALAEWLGNEAARAAASAAARAVVERGRGAADRSLELVIDLVERPLHPTP